MGPYVWGVRRRAGSRRRGGRSGPTHAVAPGVRQLRRLAPQPRGLSGDGRRGRPLAVRPLRVPMAGFQDHFSGHADRYAAARPTYPEPLFAWMAATCSRRADAWDVGCGNGQAAVRLAAYFDRVLATDPSAAQIDHAIAHPGVEYRVEPAERCSAPDGSFDLVSVAQALHCCALATFFAVVRRLPRTRAFV